MKNYTLINECPVTGDNESVRYFDLGNIPLVNNLCDTREEAIEELEVIAKVDDDREVAHIDADGVLCELLTSLGYKDVVTAYHNISKWYA